MASPNDGKDAADLVEDAEEAKLVQEMVASLEIVGTRKVQKTKSEKLHVDYVIHVGTVIPGVNWNVNRRYNSFLELHNNLKKLPGVKEKDLPTLPPKHLTSLRRTITPEAIEKRKVELNAYLNALLKNAQIAKCDVWCAFLVGTFHDIFQRLKGFALRSRQLEGEVKAGEQQRLAAVAQLQAERRRTDELRSTLDVVEAAHKKLTDSSSANLTSNTEAMTALRSEVASLKTQLVSQSEKSILELRDCQSKWDTAKASLEEYIYRLQQTQNHTLKTNAALTAEVEQLKSQKKLLVKAVKELRETTKSTAATAATATATATAPADAPPGTAAAASAGAAPATTPQA